MKKIFYTSVLALAIFLVGCPQPPAGDNSNSNENTAAEPAKDLKASIIEIENKAYEAWKSKDSKFFDANLADNFVGVGVGGATDKASTVKQMADSPCEVSSFKITDENLLEIDANTALLTTKVNADYKCGGVAGPDETYTSSLYVKDGDSWKIAYHQNVVSAGAKIVATPPPPADGAEMPADKEARNVLKPAADAAIRKALSANENTLWDAFAKSDGKPFEEHLADNFINLTPTGNQDKAATVKLISEGGCKIKSHALSDWKVTKISETAAVLNYKGTQEGTCGDQAIAANTWSTSIWVKDGDAWKAVFHAETDVPTGKVEKPAEDATPEEAKKPESDA